MTELERLRKATRNLQADMIAMQSILPWMIGHIAVSSGQEPPDVVRDLHRMAQSSVERWVIEADESVAIRIREAAAGSVDRILSGLRLTRLPD